MCDVKENLNVSKKSLSIKCSKQVIKCFEQNFISNFNNVLERISYKNSYSNRKNKAHHVYSRKRISYAKTFYDNK